MEKDTILAAAPAVAMLRSGCGAFLLAATPTHRARAQTHPHTIRPPPFSHYHTHHTPTLKQTRRDGTDKGNRTDRREQRKVTHTHMHVRTHARTQTQHNANARACFSPQISHGSKEDHALTRTTNLEERTTFLHTSTHTHTPYVHTYTHTYTHFIGYLLHSPLQLIILGVNA